MSYNFLEWKCSRWNTPVSDAQGGVSLESLCIRGNLQIVLDPSNVTVSRPKIKITFSKSMAFRCLEESYMTALWGRLAGCLGGTFFVDESPWISEISKQDSLFRELSKAARHYVIATDAEVIEVITTFPPRIESE